MWMSGMRKTPNLTKDDIMACMPIGLFASLAHCGTVLASAVGAVSFAQIVKACEPVFAAAVGLMVPPMDVKPVMAYMMLIPIVGGVGLACVKEGKGIDINVEAFFYASLANAAAALKVCRFVYFIKFTWMNMNICTNSMPLTISLIITG